MPPEHAVSLSGHRPSAVLDVIRARVRSGSRDDGHRLAVVVEGGCMRGVYTAASLLGLHLIGMSNLFDSAYATSAGAVNTAHFLSGRGDVKCDTYYRCLADGRFYDPGRVSKVVDIDFFVDEVLTTLRPVEVKRIMDSPTAFWIAVADAATARSLTFHAQTSEFPLLQILKAATAMPVLYNKLIDLGAVRGFDAGFITPFPLDEALADGHSHILVLFATPQEFNPAPWTAREKLLINYRFARNNGPLNEMYERSTAVCRRLREIATGRIESPFPACIATIAPTDSSVEITTQDPAILQAALIETARGTLGLFGHTEDDLNELVRTGTL